MYFNKIGFLFNPLNFMNLKNDSKKGSTAFTSLAKRSMTHKRLRIRDEILPSPLKRETEAQRNEVTFSRIHSLLKYQAGIINQNS